MEQQRHSQLPHSTRILLLPFLVSIQAQKLHFMFAQNQNSWLQPGHTVIMLNKPWFVVPLGLVYPKPEIHPPQAHVSCVSLSVHKNPYGIH